MGTGEIRSLVQQAATDLRDLPLDDGVRHVAARDVQRALDHAALYQSLPVPNVHQADIQSTGSGSLNAYSFNIIDRYDERGSLFNNNDIHDPDDQVYADGVCLTLTEHGSRNAPGTLEPEHYTVTYADGACPE